MSMQMDADFKKKYRMVPFLFGWEHWKGGLGGEWSLRNIHPKMYKLNTLLPLLFISELTHFPSYMVYTEIRRIYSIWKSHVRFRPTLLMWSERLRTRGNDCWDSSYDLLKGWAIEGNENWGKCKYMHAKLYQDVSSHTLFGSVKKW